ncbi:preprotein translocase subunit SecE [Nakamurella flavida]|uniref:Protein translocase subunit SecE n=1 Tax=Nakamurella flavida TaxID=363630 RepID=A0A938YDT8_9ACTN|nr:preprotein translocase subunit SecE [Nakamurella flavida]
MDGTGSSPLTPSPEDAERTVEAAEPDGDTGTTGDRETAAVGAGVAAGSARAAARRSAGSAPAEADEGKGAPTQRRGSEAPARGNIFARLARFLREVVAELRKVIWPNRNQMVTYTIVVIVFVVFMVTLVALLDLLFAKGVLGVFG